MAILPQDRRSPIEHILSIPARLEEEIKAFAESLDHSDIEYTILAILQHHFDLLKSKRPVGDSTHGKRPKDNGRKGK
jgi:hypothetical protein